MWLEESVTKYQIQQIDWFKLLWLNECGPGIITRYISSFYQMMEFLNEKIIVSPLHFQSSRTDLALFASFGAKHCITMKLEND